MNNKNYKNTEFTDETRSIRIIWLSLVWLKVYDFYEQMELIFGWFVLISGFTMHQS